VKALKRILLPEEGSDFAGLPEGEARKTGEASSSLGRCGATVTTERRARGENRRSAIARLRAAREKKLSMQSRRMQITNARRRQQTPVIVDKRESHMGHHILLAGMPSHLSILITWHLPDYVASYGFTQWGAEGMERAWGVEVRWGVHKASF